MVLGNQVYVNLLKQRSWTRLLPKVLFKPKPFCKSQWWHYQSTFFLSCLLVTGITYCQSNDQGLQCDEDGQYRPSQQDPDTKKSFCTDSFGASLDWTETDNLLTDSQCLGKFQNILDMFSPYVSETSLWSSCHKDSLCHSCGLCFRTHSALKHILPWFCVSWLHWGSYFMER